MSSAARFAIMGSGGVGGYYGACLARAGVDVTFIARGPHLRAMRDDGLSIEEPDGSTTRYDVVATDDPSRVGPVDFVLFAVKLWDTIEAGAACKPLLGDDTAVVSLQNGVNAERDLSEILGQQHVMGGVTEIFATIAAPGLIKRVSPFARLRFGEMDKRESPRAMRLGQLLAVPGIEIEHCADIEKALWEKFLLLIGVSATTALTRLPIGAVRDDPETRALLVQIMTEVHIVARAGGVALDDAIVEARLAFIDKMRPDMRASMAHDLEAGRRLELPWLSGAVVDMGKRLGVPTPANQFVFAALKLYANGAPAC